jgi:hypothetical protein
MSIYRIQDNQASRVLSDHKESVRKTMAVIKDSLELTA